MKFQKPTEKPTRSTNSNEGGPQTDKKSEATTRSFEQGNPMKAPPHKLS